MNPEEERKALELRILEVIQDKLQRGEMDEKRAQTIAQVILETFVPNMSLDALFQAVQKIDTRFQELAVALTPVLQAHEEQIKNIITRHLPTLIQEGKYEDATNLIKQATQK